MNMYKNGNDQFLFVLWAVVKCTDFFFRGEGGGAEVTGIICRDMSKLWFMPRQPEDKRIVLKGSDDSM
jgi:hypothetical protein